MHEETIINVIYLGMKKFYTIMLSAAVCFSAGAYELQTSCSDVRFPAKGNVAVDRVASKLVKKDAPASRAALTLQDYEGVYTWYTYQPVNGQLESKEYELEFVIADEATGEMAIWGISEQYALSATLDLAKGTLTIPAGQYLGPFEGTDENGKPVSGEQFWYYKDVEVSANGETFSVLPGIGSQQASVGKVVDGSITFPVYDMWCWGVVDKEDFATATEYGTVLLFIRNTLDIYIDPTIGWVDYCTGVFEDGWGVPGVEQDPAAFPWSVKIQQNENDPGRYRLLNPYMAEGCPFADVSTEGYIVFNLADPEFVMVLPGYASGYKTGNGDIYCFNFEGYLCADGTYTKDQVIDIFMENGITEWSKLDGKVVTIPTCRFDFDRTCASAYTWQNQQGGSLADLMKAKITFDKTPDSVESISVDNANGEVEYYNLQGVRLDRPAKGINIRVADGKATKVVVR